MWRDDASLLDILLAAGDAREFIHGLDWTGFSSSKLHQSAVVRCGGIIGEATASVSREFQESHPEIPWRKIIGMRHRLVHAYNEVRAPSLVEKRTWQPPTVDAEGGGKDAVDAALNTAIEGATVSKECATVVARA